MPRAQPPQDQPAHYSSWDLSPNQWAELMEEYLYRDVCEHAPKKAKPSRPPQTEPHTHISLEACCETWKAQNAIRDAVDTALLLKQDVDNEPTAAVQRELDLLHQSCEKISQRLQYLSSEARCELDATLHTLEEVARYEQASTMLAEQLTILQTHLTRARTIYSKKEHRGKKLAYAKPRLVHILKQIFETYHECEPDESGKIIRENEYRFIAKTLKLAGFPAESERIRHILMSPPPQ